MTEQKAIELLKKVTPIIPMSQTKYNQFIDAINMGMDALEKQIAKKPIYRETKYKEHKWRLTDDGRMDEFAYSYAYCNGPVCKRCHHSFCIHCNPDGYKEPCIVKEYLCPTCNRKVTYKQNFCNCDQKLDWSDIDD